MRKWIFFGLISLSLIACKDFIAKDISGKTPILILPQSGQTIASSPVHFKWSEMEGASKYHLMVVSTGFSSIDAYHLDTLVTGTDFNFALDSNEYELKLVALNAGYNSDTLGPIKFWVDSSPVGPGASVNLTSPVDGSYHNSSFTKVFDWETFTGAQNYEISIRKGINYATGSVVDGEIGNTTAIYSSQADFDEGNYHWAVKAYYPGGETNLSHATFYIDTTKPMNGLLASPADFDTETAGNIAFSWTVPSDIGIVQSPVKTIVQVDTDQNFNSSDLIADTLSGTTITLDIQTTGVHYWRVYAIDQAGNVSSTYSDHNQFTVNP